MTKTPLAAVAVSENCVKPPPSAPTVPPSFVKFPLAAGDLPPFADDLRLGGNELEGVLVRALRTHELSPEPKRPVKEVLAELLREVRPNPHTRKLEYMDLVAVKECTDVRFLPQRFRDLTPEELEERIDELRRFV